jgi:hypothetical protein
MPSYRTLDDVTVEYFTQHSDEIERFLNERFAEYAVAGDVAALPVKGAADSLICCQPTAR